MNLLPAETGMGRGQDTGGRRRGDCRLAERARGTGEQGTAGVRRLVSSPERAAVGKGRNASEAPSPPGDSGPQGVPRASLRVTGWSHPAARQLSPGMTQGGSSAPRPPRLRLGSAPHLPSQWERIDEAHAACPTARHRQTRTGLTAEPVPNDAFAGQQRPGLSSRLDFTPAVFLAAFTRTVTVKQPAHRPNLLPPDPHPPPALNPSPSPTVGVIYMHLLNLLMGTFLLEWNLDA